MCSEIVAIDYKINTNRTICENVGILYVVFIVI